MKLITFGVPSYNSESYLKKCIDSLLTGGDEVEIVIVNDGSKDSTGAIADEYAKNYPTIVKAVHQENGGHGSGVNAGLKNAKGMYYKVVDSDDWVDTEALKKLLDTIRNHIQQKTIVDMYVCNFVYEHVYDNTQKVSDYISNFPIEKICDWNEVKPFKSWRLLLMHSIICRTEVLKACKVELPKHTFYVDNVFAYYSIPYMKNVYYLNIDLYRYFIGRSDQSVNVKNLVKRYDQQIRCMKCIVDAHSYDEIKSMKKGLKKYMLHAVGDYMLNTIFFTSADDTKERRQALKELWAYIKGKDKKLYKKLRWNLYPALICRLPYRLQGKLTTFGYNLLCKKVKLG